MSEINCPVCSEPAGLIVLDGGPCMDCIRARARVATGGGRCACSAKLRRPGDIRSIGSRFWQDCLRCLGTIRQYA